MKRLICVLVVFVAIAWGAHFMFHDYTDTQSKSEEVVSLNNSDVFVFVKDGCPFCHQAMDYIHQKYPNDQTIKILNIYQNKQNMKLFMDCANREHVPQSQLGTPLICFPDNAILGWSAQAGEYFDAQMKKRSNTQ